MAANKSVGDIPLPEKLNLTVAEAAVYTGIGQVALRNLMKEPDCSFVLKITPRKSLIRRKELEEYLKARESLY